MPSDAVNPADVHAVVMAYGSGVERELLGWLGEAVAEGATWGLGADVAGCSPSRNATCTDALEAWQAGTGRRYLLMVDRDTLPMGLGILTEPGPVVWLDYPGGDGGRGHIGAAEMACGCMRIDLEALAKIPRPWFGPLRDGRGRILLCECGMFANRARRAQVGGRCVGHAWHRLPRWYRYDDDGGVQAAWPHEVLGG